MLSAQRLASIVELISRQGSVTVGELEKMFAVSRMTVHRDLARLEQEGILRRVQGGAILSNTTSAELSFALREQKRKKEKWWIGVKACDLVDDGTAVVVDASTTALHFIRSLKKKEFSNLTVLTPGLKTALELVGKPGVQTILCGGMLRETSLSVVGKLASGILQEFHPVKAFVSGEGLTFEAGVTASNLLEVEMKQEMIKAARETILLLDSSKFGKKAFITIAPVTVFKTIVTDRGAPQEYIEELAARGVEVIVA